RVEPPIDTGNSVIRGPPAPNSAGVTHRHWQQCYPRPPGPQFWGSHPPKVGGSLVLNPTLGRARVAPPRIGAQGGPNGYF
ncbi:MAG: hypothetical protein ABIG63_18685, partial [Chloroflexota bacterium]